VESLLRRLPPLLLTLMLLLPRVAIHARMDGFCAVIAMEVDVVLRIMFVVLVVRLR
jgi:hypothetical protein